MALYKNVTPQPPQPTDKHDVDREAQSIKALDEVKRVVLGLIETLAPFVPTQFKTADGKTVRGLAQMLGNAAPSDAATPEFTCYDASTTTTGGTYTAKFGVRPGNQSGNGIGYAGGVSTLPDVFDPDASYNWIIPISGYTVVYLKTTISQTDPDDPTTAQVTANSGSYGSTQPGDTDTVGCTALGSCTLDSGGKLKIITGQIGIGPQTISICNKKWYHDPMSGQINPGYAQIPIPDPGGGGNQ